MWIRCPNGVDTIVHDDAHIKRLMAEGGMPLPDHAEEILPQLEDQVVEVSPLPLLEDRAVEIVPLPLIQNATGKKPGRSRG